MGEAQINNMYELIQRGNNIHNRREHSSINNTQRIARNISSKRYNKSSLEDLLKKIVQAQAKALYTGDDLSVLMNTTFKKWELSSKINYEDSVSMNNLKEWQQELVHTLKEIEETKRVVFNDQQTYWDMKIVVKEPSAMLTFKYSKKIIEFIALNNINLEFVVLGEESFLNDPSNIEVIVSNG